MDSKQANLRKVRPVAATKAVSKQSGESIAAKRQRLHTMLRDIRREAEEMSANADKLLARFS